MVILRDTATPAALEASKSPAPSEHTTQASDGSSTPKPSRVSESSVSQTATAETPPNYYGLRILPPLTAVVELAVIVTVLLTIDWIWPALDINAMQPNPYWVPVLLLTLQYGTASGTLAVLVAIAAYFAFVTLPEQGVGENEFAYRLRILANPILWIATAVVLGQFRMIQIAAKRELMARLGELETQRATLADYANRLRSRCDLLERDIVSRPFYAGIALLDALAALRCPSQTPQHGIATVLGAAFPGAAISLFVRDGAVLRQVAASGWNETTKWAGILPADHRLPHAILNSQLRLCVLRAADEVILDHQGLAAVPVVDRRTGRSQGMIKLEFADARLVTLDCLTQMDVIAAAIAPLLVAQGDRIELSKNGAIDNNDVAAGSIAMGRSAVTTSATIAGHDRSMDNGNPNGSRLLGGR